MNKLLASEPYKNKDLFRLCKSSHKKKAPALFYFALTAQESLTLDPLNQVVSFVDDTPIEVFSLTIPGHGPGLNPNDAIAWWAKQFALGIHPLEAFFETASKAIDCLIADGDIDSDRIAVAGLSRGAFCATHIAAQDTRVKAVLAFAPLTHLSFQESFQSIGNNPLVQKNNLCNLVDKLTHVQFKAYIGNNDEKVSTNCCYDFIHALVRAHKKKRHIPVELVISPSIGHKGHGTAKETFFDGALWLKKLLLEHVS